MMVQGCKSPVGLSGPARARSALAYIRCFSRPSLHTVLAPRPASEQQPLSEHQLVLCHRTLYTRCWQTAPLHRRSTVASAGAAATSRTEPHLQLGTAKLPSALQVAPFAELMYQWAATMTQSGANFPFALPIKADKLDTGFKISLLKRGPKGGFDSAGEIEATVEPIAGEGNIFFIRFYEGPAGMSDRRTPPPADPTARLEVVLESLVDVPVIMGTMPQAIRKAIVQAMA